MDRKSRILIFCLIAVAMTGIASASGDLKVYYLNTTQGDATLLESSGHFMMVNAGEKQDSSEIIQYLKETGVTSLDYAFATTLNESAIGGMGDLMQTFPVSVYCDPSVSFSSPSHNAIKTKIESDQIGYQEATSGAGLLFGAANIQILNTSTSKNNASENAMSLSVTLGNVSFLFTGKPDLGPNPATVWEAPDQGRDGSISALSAVSPQCLVISTGANGPSNNTLETLKKLKTNYLLTNKDGNIVFSTDGNNYSAVTSNGNSFQKPTPSETPTPKPALVQGNSTTTQDIRK